jgi:hypothetical protein
MSSHFGCGAFIRGTENFITVNNASKGKQYECPHCRKPVCFKNGKKKRPHFAHFASDSPCSYYDKPSESQIHKDAKYCLRTELNEHREMLFYRECEKCHCNYDVLHVTSDTYNEHTKGMCEHDCRFKYDESMKIPDVALVENGIIKHIFEIYHTHRTSENSRPPHIPWVEIKAQPFVNYINTTSDTELRIQCMRDFICECCILDNERMAAIENERREAKRIAEEQKRETKRIEDERKEKERIEKDRLEALKKERERIEKERKQKEFLLIMEKRRLEELEKEKERAKRAAEEWERGAPERARLAEEKRIREEQLRLQWEEESKLRRADKQREIEDRVKKTTVHPKPCGLSLINMCDCINNGLVPDYEAARLTGKLYCKLCKKWKCRCTA